MASISTAYRVLDGCDKGADNGEMARGRRAQLNDRAQWSTPGSIPISALARSAPATARSGITTAPCARERALHTNL